MRNYLFSIVFIPLYIEASLITPCSPWGTVVRCPVGMSEEEALRLYSQVLDSVVSAGISWVRLTATPPGGIQLENLYIQLDKADDYISRIDAHDLNPLAMWFPHKKTNAQTEPPEFWWKDFWYKVVEHYDGDGVNDMPGLTKPIKYWYISFEPQIHCHLVWRRDWNWENAFDITPKSIDEVALRKDNYYDPNTDTWYYYVDPKKPPCSNFLSMWNNFYNEELTFFYNYIRVNFEAIHDPTYGDPDAKVVAPGYQYTTPNWTIRVKDKDGKKIYVDFLYFPGSDGMVNATELAFKDLLEKVGEYVDVIAMHGYARKAEIMPVDTISINDWLDIKFLCALYSKPLWITEFGWGVKGVRANYQYYANVLLPTLAVLDTIGDRYEHAYTRLADAMETGQLDPLENKIFFHQFWEEAPPGISREFIQWTMQAPPRDTMGVLNHSLEHLPAYESLTEVILSPSNIDIALPPITLDGLRAGGIGENRVELTWINPSNIWTNYTVEIWRKPDLYGNDFFGWIGAVQPTKQNLCYFIDEGLEPNRFYSYKARAKTDNCPFSETSSALTAYFEAGEGLFATPVVADLDGDSNEEIIVGGSNGLYVFNKDGTNYPGWPMTNIGEIKSKVAVGDVDRNGTLEIVFIAGDYIHIVEHMGNSISPFWPRYLPEACVESPPVIMDLDGSGDLEIIITEEDSICVFDHEAINTGIKWKRPHSLFYTPPQSWIRHSLPSPAVGDIDRNIPGIEIAFPPYIWDASGNQIGSLEEFGDFLTASPVLGDINGDGNLEIVVGWETMGSGKVIVYDYAHATHSEVQPVGDEEVLVPVLANIKGDKKPEIIAAEVLINVVQPRTPRIFAWEWDGQNYSLISDWPTEVPCLNGREKWLSTSGPVTGNVYRDENPEILVPYWMSTDYDGYNGYIVTLNTNAQEVSYYGPSHAKIGYPGVNLSDFDKDGNVDVEYGGPDKVYTFKLKTSQIIEWNETYHDRYNTSNYEWDIGRLRCVLHMLKLTLYLMTK